METIRRRVKLQWKRIVSMLLAVFMLLTSAPLSDLAYANEVSGEREVQLLGMEGVVSPEVNGKNVTFRYKDADAGAVYLAGEMNGWNSKANLMTRNSEGVWEITLPLEYGKYEYKFVVGDNDWKRDPGNSLTSGDNSLVIVPGLMGKSISCMRGGSIELPQQLDQIDSDGNKKAVNVTYALKDSSTDGVVLGTDGSKQTFEVSEVYTGYKIELEAKSDDGTVTIVPVLVGDGFLVVEYTRDDKNYAGMNVYSWGGSSDAVNLDFETVNGKCIARIPVTASANEKTVGFIVKRGDGWNEKHGGDNNVKFPADQKVVKVKFADDKVSGQYPYNTGAELDAANQKAHFYFREDKAFLNDALGELAGKVNLVLRKSTEETVNTYPMSYEVGNARFAYSIDLEDATDYYYYYEVDGQKILDAYNEDTIEVDEATYSRLRNKKYQVEVTASVKNASMDYNDNNLLCVDWSGKNGDDLEGFAVKEIYADLSSLGMGGRVAIDPVLKTLAIGCDRNIGAGEKKITVTLKDDGGQIYSAQTMVNVTERVKADGDFDWDEAVIYFAVTDRFYDGDESNNTLVDKNDTTNGSRYHGGDFKGLTDKLDYLKELGVNTIWLTPVVDNITKNVRETEAQGDGQESYGYHGYWASDFTKLNPHLGTEEQFKTLISSAHERDMKIMVDVVLNHAGYGTEDYFNNIISNGADGYIPMIRGEEDKISGDDKLDSLSGLPDFMTENEKVRNQLVEWQVQWIRDYDIDYYRVDTVKHVDSTTWSAFKNALTEVKPEFKLIGEYFGANYNNSSIYQNNGTMDSLLDFGFKDYAKKFADGDIAGAEAILTERNASIGNTAMLGQFLSSHDEQGLLTTLTDAYGENQANALMKVAAALQITAKGQPVIYYGEELGQTGRNNYPLQENRYDFDWNMVDSQKADADSFYNHYRKLLNIRNEYTAVFAKGDRNVIKSSNADGYDIVRRSYGGQSLYVAMNVKQADNSVTFETNAKAGSVYKDLYDGAKKYTVGSDGSLTVTVPSANKGGTAILVLNEGTEEEVVDTNRVTVKLHYKRPDGNYAEWNAWIWSDGLGGNAYDFAEVNGEMVATITVDGRAANKINYIIRKGDWKEKDVDADQSIDISDIVSGTVHFYVNAGVAGGTRSLGTDAVRGVKILSAKYDENSRKVIVETSAPVSGDIRQAFTFKRADGMVIAITNVAGSAKKYEFTLDVDLSQMQNLMKSYVICYDGYEYALGMPNVYASEAFESKYTYNGNDLGATWSKTSTTFKVWAPTADNVQVALYASGTEGTNDRISTYDMSLGDKGVWSVKVDGNLNGKYYTYLVDVEGKTNEACDPYARTTGVNGKRAMILDLKSTDPIGWDRDVSPNKGMTYTDAVIYELHVRDASIDAGSGVSKKNQGKFLGLTERGTTTANGTPTVLDHMKNLGVTHVHLLPVYDYGSVDETKLDEPQFNWGYDPVNYNVPEGSYSTDPYNGDVRVSEMKQMVMNLHENNINVVMDVVYNHVYDAESFGFNQIVPKYFSRTNADGSYSNGSGCGNDTASERAMVHKYIVDSVMYWAQEYHIDGFRFDLVGLLDAETMNDVIDTVHAKYPDIIFYGEGWTMNTAVGKENVVMATQQNAASTPNLAYFNDTIRNLLAGNNDAKYPGFVSGSKGKESDIAKCYQAKAEWCPEPTQTVNYVSCHDNYTLKDKLNLTRADASEEERIKMNNLAAAIYMMSEGIPFIHAGEEFLRTKIDENGEVIHNSYNSSDYVNRLRWNNLEKPEYARVADYYKGLIEFRKNHQALRLTTREEVAANVEYQWVTNEVVLFNIAGKDSVAGEVSDGIVIIFNANAEEKEVDLNKYNIAEGEWKVCVNDQNAGIEVLDTITDGKVTVAPISAMVLVKGETRDQNSVYVKNAVTDTEDTNVSDANGGNVDTDSAVTEGDRIYVDTQIKPGAPKTTINTDRKTLVTASGILTESEKQAVANGVDARIWLVVEALKESLVPAADKTAVEKKAQSIAGKNAKITYLDLALWKQVGNAQECLVPTPGLKMSVTITIPKNLRSTDKTKKRTYYMIRVHDGVSTVIDGSYNEKTAEFTFETDRFSTYAIVYQEVDAAVSFSKLKAGAIKTTKDTVSLKWSKVSGADGYLVYGNKCNTKDQKYAYELLGKTSKNQTTKTIMGLEKGTYYKYKIVAYKLVNGKKVRIATSTVIRTVTAGGRYGVAKEVQIHKIGGKKYNSASAVKVVLGKGKTAKIVAAAVNTDKKIRYYGELGYESSNTTVAKVSKGGKITAVGKGTCKIYVYAQNGVYKTITVTVK